MNRFLKSFIAVVFVFAVAQIAFAATFTVTKIADTNDGVCDADCSLREAVGAANASADDDIIEFDAGVFGTAQTITLSGTEIVITSNGTLTINGTGADMLTIDGNLTSRILNVILATAFINDMTFTRGNGVGALNTGRGGAIYNAGGITAINNSIITGNSGANGGGLSNAATTGPSVPANLTINNSIISNNTASGSGGALQNFRPAR